jgi:hypothetical protein
MFASITHIPSLHKILSNMPKHKLTMSVPMMESARQLLLLLPPGLSGLCCAW